MEKRRSVPLSAFAIAVLFFAKTHSKGTVLFFKSEHEYGKLIIEGGEIVALQYNGKENEEALDALEGLSTVRYRCHPFRLPPKNRFQLSLEDFFQKIGGLDLQNLSNEPSLPEETEQPTLQEQINFPAILGFLKESLHDALGPISEFIYEDAVGELGAPNSLELVEALSSKLAQDIDNPEHRKEFEKKTQNIISSRAELKVLET